MTAATFPAEKFAAAGRLTAITAGNDSDKDNVADLSYTWDDIGNLTSRSDNIETYTENFCYDALNRLTSNRSAAPKRCCYGPSCLGCIGKLEPNQPWFLIQW